MKDFRSSVLVLVALAVTVGLLTMAAAAPVPPEKKCYDAGGEEIPCPESNYLQTQKAIRDASRDSGPTYTPVPPTYTLSPTASPTATPTITAIPTESPTPGAAPEPLAVPPAASSPPETSPWLSSILVLVPLLLLGCAGLIGVILLVILVRWLSRRRSAPPGSPMAQ